MSCSDCDRKRLLQQKQLLETFSRRIVFDANSLSLTETILLSGIIRDIKMNDPTIGIGIKTPFELFFLGNPHIFRFNESHNTETIELSNIVYSKKQHIMENIRIAVQEKTKLIAPFSKLGGDYILPDIEKQVRFANSFNVNNNYGVILAGGTHNNTWKWYHNYQKIVDHFKDKLPFFQCGAKDDWHIGLNNAINIVGKTNIREFANFLYHAKFIVCPLSMPMHLTAALPLNESILRSTIVIAGGNEPGAFQTYPDHIVLANIEQMECSNIDNGCNKVRCQQTGDGKAIDRENLCENYNTINGLRFAKCMSKIDPTTIIKIIEK